MDKATYLFRYCVAAVALSRACPSRIAWWLLTRRMFDLSDSDGSLR